MAELTLSRPADGPWFPPMRMHAYVNGSRHRLARGSQVVVPVEAGKTRFLFASGLVESGAWEAEFAEFDEASVSVTSNAPTPVDQHHPWVVTQTCGPEFVEVEPGGEIDQKSRAQTLFTVANVVGFLAIPAMWTLWDLHPLIAVAIYLLITTPFAWSVTRQVRQTHSERSRPSEAASANN